MTDLAPPVLHICRHDGLDVCVREGSRLEFDLIAGISVVDIPAGNGVRDREEANVAQWEAGEHPIGEADVKAFLRILQQEFLALNLPIHGSGFPGWGPPTLCGQAGLLPEGGCGEVTCDNCVEILVDHEGLAKRAAELEATIGPPLRGAC